MPFSVICNGCDVTARPATVNAREKLGLDADDFVFIFAGNISPNKNQKQVIDALAILKKEGCSGIKVIFAGGGDVESLRQHASQLEVDDLVKILGFVDKTKLPDYYHASDATILTSLTEGFGLSIVEGYVYGKPSLVFSDLPAVPDLYSPDVMLLCKTRQTVDLALKMIEMSQLHWDRERIRLFARHFSFENMAAAYNAVYNHTLHK